MKLINQRKFIMGALLALLMIGVTDHTTTDAVEDQEDLTQNDTSRDGEGDTFSIVAYDKTTGQVGGAGCSCVSISGGIDFLSDLITDGTTNSDNIVGAIHSQASYQEPNQITARNRMLAGDSPQQIIDFVVNNDCCGGPASRQYGVVGVDNPGAAGYTGSSNGNYANDLQIDNALYTVSIQGNILDTSNGQDLLDDMRDTFNSSTGTLGDKLMAAMQAAKRVGGDNRCQGSGNSGRTAFVQVLSPGETSPSLFFTTGNAVGTGVEPIDELQCLYDSSITPPTCRETVTSFPYVMDFEDTVWVKDADNCTGNDKSWIRSRFATPSSNTGPSGASQGQLYMFVEASSFFNARAIMTSPCLALPSNETYNLSFNYHMFGADMGTLSATINNGSGWVPLWSLSGDQGNSWQSQEIDLSAYQGQTVRIRFDATTGANFASDMAVDNIRIGAPAPVNCNAVVDSFPYNEGFESNFGDWNNVGNDDIDWSRNSNGTPSNNTGPSSAFEGNVYIYVEASGNGTGYPNKRAIIESACFDLSDSNTASFDFNYHQFGAADMGTIDLEVSTNGGNSWSSIWNSSGNLGNQWFAQSIDLDPYVGQSAVQLRFNRVTGGTWQADIALDNFVLTAEGGPDITPPTDPTNLTASNTTQTTTDLSWDASTDNVGVTEYDVYQGAAVIGTTPNTNFNVTGLTAATSYAFTVVAKDAAGNESAPSNVANVTTLDPPDTEAPTVPTDLAASNITLTSLDLSWTASTDNVGVTEYDVFEGVNLVGSTAGTTLNVTGLSPATLYTFTVVAKDAAGNESDASAPLDVTTLSDTTPPSAPTNLTAANTTQTSTDLSWDASTDNVGVTDYDVYQGAVVIGNTSNTNFNVTGLTAATSYAFTVVARDAEGNQSAASNVANVTTLDPPDTEAPSIPTGLAASNITLTSLDLSWTASTDNVGVTEYDVFEGASLIGSTAGTTLGVVGLSPATLYSFSVVAKDAAGNESAASDPLDVTTLSDTTAPSGPTNLTAANTTQTTTDLSWDAASDNIGVADYDVYQGASVIATTVDTNFNVTGLTANTSYAFTVVAKDEAGNESTPSNVANVTTLEESTGCSGGISGYPYAESFEASFGGWVQSANDDLDWSRNSGGTPSQGTGPASAIDGSVYIYVEASGDGTGFPNKRAIITSPCFDLSGESVAFFNFNYHQFGSTDMGSITLEISDDDGANWTALWSSTGNQGNSWLGASIDLSTYVGGGIQLRFNRLTGGIWQADIAIDNIRLVNQVNAGCSGGESLPYSESFESSIGSWSQASGDDLDWTRDSGGTPSNNTGPSSGSNGSFYMYVEASGNGTGYPDKQAIFNSPCFDLSAVNQANFDFDYHMFGAADMGVIILEVSTDDGQIWSPIWSQTGNQGNQWNSVSLDISAYTGGGALFRFNRVTGSTWQADIAIDNVTVNGSSGSLPVIPTGPVAIAGDTDIPSISFSLYPNPVRQGLLFIATNAKIDTYRIYNMQGQVVDSGEFTESIDVSRLSSAMYFIELQSGAQRLQGNFIVE